MTNKKIYITILIATALLYHCKNSSGPSISLGSTIFNEDTLKSDMPDYYSQIKEQYEQQLHQSLKRIATQKMIEMAAKDNKQTAQEYMQSKIQAIPAPTEEELMETYQLLSAAGEIEKKSFEQQKDQIRNMIMEDRREETVAVELGKLRKKYEYKDSFEIRKDISADKARKRGEHKEGAVTIIEFSDFECPYCARSQKTTKKLRQMYGDKIQFAFYDFPLDFHKNAMYAHVAGQCIAQQSTESFWKYFDTLFVRQGQDHNSIARENIDALISTLNINNSNFKGCVNDPATRTKIEEEMKLGSSVGVRGTPAFFINGRFINGAAPLSDFVE